ncbi:uncharacterized protein LOC132262790 [Phlebotomus argentipes]|uniref:uncharacterized protein LOC132262790 n=1 Tax=Phlebotomus argentipes TaxID=94469 RepID=UPI00289324BE|nr:uncharacterized protein LOC132262790 [Phlebotomus argentipes]
MCLDGVDKHKIWLKNLQNNEKIPHSVLFVSGEIDHKCSRNTLSISLNSEYRENCKVSRENSEFKCLLTLNVGLNRITLNYCDCELVIHVSHEVSVNPRTVTPLYIVVKDHDGRFQAKERNSVANALARITLGVRIVQMIFAENLRASGVSGRKTFNLSGDCQPFHSELSAEEASRMTENQLWSFFARELIERTPDCRNRKFVAYLSCTRYRGAEDASYESIRAATVANAALASGGLALLGSACLFSWPEAVQDVRGCLEDETRVPLAELMDDSAYRGTFGGCFATSLGALLHEMGHIFDLAHCADGVMGNDSDRLDQMLTLRDFHGRWRVLPRRRVPTGREGVAKCTVVRRTAGCAVSHSSGVYFAENCSVLLASHKWFNDSAPQLDGGLAFNAATREICGKYPVRLVEMRNAAGFVERYWIISASADTNHIYFMIPPHIQLMNCTLFCIDVHGNTLTQDL